MPASLPVVVTSKLALRNGVAEPGSGVVDVVSEHGVREDYDRPGSERGLPCIRDTRVTVSAVLGQLAAGRSPEEVLADYPYLQRADILGALEFAADAVQEHELPLAQPA
jgi:uncharacterized protein (DUF433 family)